MLTGAQQGKIDQHHVQKFISNKQLFTRVAIIALLSGSLLLRWRHFQVKEVEVLTLGPLAAKRAVQQQQPVQGAKTTAELNSGAVRQLHSIDSCCTQELFATQMRRLRAVQVSAVEAPHTHDYTNALDVDGALGVTLPRMPRLGALTPAEAIALAIVVLVTIVTLACCCKRKVARCFACCGCTSCLKALEAHASDDEDEDDDGEECDHSCGSSVDHHNCQTNAETDTESEEEEDVVPYSDQDYDREFVSRSSVATHHRSDSSAKQCQASDPRQPVSGTRHRSKRTHRQQLHGVVEHKADEPWEPDLEELERAPALHRAQSVQTMHKKAALKTRSMTDVRDISTHGARPQVATRRRLDKVERTARRRRTGSEMQQLPPKKQSEEQRKSRIRVGVAHEMTFQQGAGEEGLVADTRESIVSNDDGSALEPEIESRIVNVIERKLIQRSVLQTAPKMPCQPLWIPPNELDDVVIEMIEYASAESGSEKDAALERHIEGVVERKLSKQSLSLSSGSGSPRHVEVAPKFNFAAELESNVGGGGGGAPPARQLRPMKSQLPGRMAASLEKKLRARATLQARSAPTTPSNRDRMLTDEENSMKRTAEIFGTLRQRPSAHALARQASSDAVLPQTDDIDVAVEVVADLEGARERCSDTAEAEATTVENSAVTYHNV